MNNKTKLNIISLILVAIYIVLMVSTNIYYNNNHQILECVHLIGPMSKCVSIYQEGQESIILMYKTLAISSYVMIFVNLIFNAYLLISNYKRKQKNILALILTIIFSFLSTVFLFNVFMV